LRTLRCSPGSLAYSEIDHMCSTSHKHAFDAGNMVIDPKYSSIPPPLETARFPSGPFLLVHIQFMDDIGACADVPGRTCAARPAGTCTGRNGKEG